jgi:hypothetical protein
MSSCLFTGSMKVLDWWQAATVEQSVYGMWKMIHGFHFCCMVSCTQAVSVLTQNFLWLGNCIVRALAVSQSYTLFWAQLMHPFQAHYNLTTHTCRTATGTAETGPRTSICLFETKELREAGTSRNLQVAHKLVSGMAASDCDALSDWTSQYHAWYVRLCFFWQ